MRLAQFYKDVELAEVLTDNDPLVADVLSTYEVLETNMDDDENQQQQSSLNVDVESKESKTRNKDDALHQVKGGGVKKKTRKRRKK